MLKDFRDFIARGNVVDLAVGIIVGAAFTSIVTSFVKDLVNPIIGLVGGNNFDNMFVVLKGPAGPFPTPADAQKAGAVTLNYGSFLTNVINFLIVAFVMFMLVKAVNKMYTKKKEDPAPAGPTPDQALLTEIRDLLKAKA
jgi:large conductance mechanosensitive channel